MKLVLIIISKLNKIFVITLQKNGCFSELCNPCSYTKQHSQNEVSTIPLSIQKGSASQARPNISRSVEKLKRNSSTLIKSTNSLRSTSIESDHSISLSVIEEPLKPTTILQPFESQSYKVRFFPDKVGQYREQFSLTIANSLDKTYIIKVEGVSDIPRINMDPSFIFNKVQIIFVFVRDTTMSFKLI